MLLRNVSAVVLASGLVLTVGCGGSSSIAGSTNPAATPTNPAVTPTNPAVTPTNPTVTPAVYTETNATTGNAVLAYSRASNGSLTAIGTYSTGGSGVGLPTYQGALPFPIGGATGAVRLSPHGNYLYAVDAGSADVAAFSVASDGSLALIGRYPTGGTSPGSITLDRTGAYLYVLNTGSVSNDNNTPGSITGFSVGPTGALTALAGSTQPLSSTANYVDPSEVAFSPNGTYLAVTEKATGLIDIYPVTDGVAGSPVSSPSAGNIPFGFAFSRSGAMVVTNVESLTTPDASTVSSYTVVAKDTVNVISNQVPDDQGGACWISLTPQTPPSTTVQYAYVSNTLSGSISGYTVGTDGTLTLLTSGGVTAAQPDTTGPIDNVITPDGAYLYVLDSNAGASPGTLAGFSIGASGALTSVTTGVSGLVPGSIGLAAR